MRCSTRAILVTTIALGANLVTGISWARAQGGGLGGYGAMAGGSALGGGTGAGMGAGAVAPFGGQFGAVMSSGMGGGGDLSFRPRPSATMSGSRTAFTIGPMGGGMSGGPGMGSGRRPFVLPNLGPSGSLGLRGSMRRPMREAAGMGVMGPNFGYPFRQPPSLVAPGASGAAMSM